MKTSAARTGDSASVEQMPSSQTPLNGSKGRRAPGKKLGEPRRSHFDITRLPIRVEYIEEPVDLVALRDALEQLLLSVEPGPESESNPHPNKSGDPHRQRRSTSRTRCEPVRRSTGGEHTVG